MIELNILFRFQRRLDFSYPVLRFWRKDSNPRCLLQVDDDDEPRPPDPVRIPQDRTSADRHRPARQLDQLEDGPQRRGLHCGAEAGSRITRHSSFKVTIL